MRLGTIIDDGGEPKFRKFETEAAAAAPAEPDFCMGKEDEDPYDTPAFLRRHAQ